MTASHSALLTIDGRLMGKYDAPMKVGGRFAVRIRRVALIRDFAGYSVVGFRLTHPNGRKGLAPDFAIRESAVRFAQQQGWTVIGSAS